MGKVNNCNIMPLDLIAALIAHSTITLVQEVTEGILTYFDHCIGTILLYRFERAQVSF